MSTTAPQISTVFRPAAKKSFQLPAWAFWIGAAFLLAAFLFVLTLLFGRVSGDEFSPHTFKRRTFHFYEIPLIRAQVWPIKRFDATGDLETQLVTDNIVTARKVAEPRWDLIRGYRGNTPVLDGDAFILTRYLDLHDEKGSHVWLTWTTDNPKLAKVLWPRIATLAEQELYLFMPDLFETAAAAKDADKLEAELIKLLSSKYHGFAGVQRELGNQELVVELLTEALKLQPMNDAWQAELETARRKAEQQAPSSSEGKQPPS